MILHSDIDGYAFGDTETTGLSFIDSDVIEVAFILNDRYCNTINQFNIKVNLPESYVWDDEAETFHGISVETAKTHGVSQLEAIETINRYFNTIFKAGTNVKLVGANSFFDFVMLQNMYDKNGAGRVPFSHRLIDVNQLGLFVGAGNSLSDICDYYEIVVDESKKHGAFYDAMLHREVFKQLIQDLQIC